jgi:hypothetical protein
MSSVLSPRESDSRRLTIHFKIEGEYPKFDYVEGAEKSLELAHEYGWTVVSIKNDWREVFEE